MVKQAGSKTCPFFSMYKTIFIIFFLCSSFIQLQAQNRWKELADVSFETVESQEGYPMDVAEFGEKVKNLKGKKIRLKGYIIPLEELRGQKYFIFSRYPFNLCYFCGAAGPETIVEVRSQEEILFTEDLIELEGLFETNASDPDHMMYLLLEARQIK
jgi:hypothetical protein